MSKVKDECYALKAQVDCLRPGDSILLDRGYYGKDLVIFFYNKGIHVICRLKENLKAVQKMKMENKTVHQANIKNFNQIIPYRTTKLKL